MRSNSRSSLVTTDIKRISNAAVRVPDRKPIAYSAGLPHSFAICVQFGIPAGCDKSDRASSPLQQQSLQQRHRDDQRSLTILGAPCLCRFGAPESSHEPANRLNTVNSGAALEPQFRREAISQTRDGRRAAQPHGRLARLQLHGSLRLCQRKGPSLHAD
jgi:hypothetical protein